MKYGMNLLLWTASVDEEQFPLLARMKEIGYDGVEIPLFEADLARSRRVRAELDNLGLACTAVAACTREANPISADPAVRRAGLDHLRRVIDASHELGAKVLCGPIHSALGHMVGRGRTPEEWGWCVETMGAAAESAAAAGVLLAVECLNRFEVYFLNTAADTRRLVDEVDHPGLHAMYDTFHANIEERSIEDAVAALGDRLAHVHISENHRGTPGTGLVQWRETFRALRASGYDGWLTVEAFGRALPDLAAATCVWRDLFDNEDNLARQSLAFMRSHWEGR